MILFAKGGPMRWLALFATAAALMGQDPDPLRKVYASAVAEYNAKDGGQPLNHEGSSGVLEPEQDYASPHARRGCSDLAKVEIERDDDPVFYLRLGKDVHI
jgi:hypothetical protein